MPKVAKSPLFKNLLALSPYLAFVIITAILFRNYFLKNQVPFPSNLQVAFYQPWAAYKWDGYQNGPPSKPIGFDNLRMFYPVRTLTLDGLKNGRLPLWNPYSFAGNTLLGTYQTAVFFPLSFLFFLLPQIDAWSIIVILSPIFCSIFSYLFLREIDINKRGSFFGALAFGFCGMMIVWWEEMFMSVYSTLTLPLIFYAIHRLSRKVSPIPFAILVAALSISIVCGYFQTTFYICLFAAAWTIFLAIGNKKWFEFMFFTFLAFVLAGTICGLQIVPGVQAYLNSARGDTDMYGMFREFFAPIGHLATLFAPDFFGTPASHNYFSSSFYHEKVIWLAAPAVFFIIYEAVNRSKSKCSRFFLILGLVIMSLAFSLPTSWFVLYQLKIPFVNQITPSRIVYLSSFCLSIVAAFGLQRFIQKPDIKKTILTSYLITLIMSILWLAAYTHAHTPGRQANFVPLRNMIVPSFFFASTTVFVFFSFLRGFWKKYFDRYHLFYIGLIVITLGSIGFFANKYLYFGERRFVFPEVGVIIKLKEIQGIDRYWSFGPGSMIRNFQNQYHLFSPEGYESFNIRRYNELAATTHTEGQLTGKLQRADASIRNISNLTELVDATYSRKMLDITGVKYIFALHQEQNPKLLEKANLELVWTDNIYDIFENKTEVPRFFLTQTYTVENDKQKIVNLLYDDNFDHQTIILEEDPQIKKTGQTGKVNLISYQPEIVKFAVDGQSDSLLYLSDNYFPGWKAYINGKETKIYRANYAFRAVVVPPGTNQVIFSYEPKSVIAGGLLSGIGIIIFIISLRFITRKKDKKG